MLRPGARKAHANDGVETTGVVRNAAAERRRTITCLCAPADQGVDITAHPSKKLFVAPHRPDRNCKCAIDIADIHEDPAPDANL
jgi:hypothetical protein